MRSGARGALVTLLLGLSAGAQVRDADRVVHVKFVVDEKVQSCDPLSVELKVGQQSITPKMVEGGFEAPEALGKLYDDEETRRVGNVPVDVRCGEQAFSRTGLYPAWVLPGSWTVGIAHPAYWAANWEYSSTFGAWTDYLESECNGCDPGVIAVVSHNDVPKHVLDQLVAEQPGARGARARDVAFALAVFDFEKRQNIAYLQHLYHECLVRPPTTEDDDEEAECDDGLLHSLTNLYWRGNNDLLPDLLRSAQSKSDAASSVGYFIGDLLDQRPAGVLAALADLTDTEQTAVCKVAAADDLSLNSPKRERVMASLHAAGGDVASRCLREIMASSP